MIRHLKKAVFLSCIMAVAAGAANAASALIPVSSSTYYGPANKTSTGRGVVVDRDGNLIVTGNSFTGLTMDCWTIKCDPNLVIIASATFDASSNDIAYGATVDKDGNIIVTGSSHNGFNTDYVTVKYDPNLVFIASAAYIGAGNESDVARGAVADKDGNIIVTGYSSNGSNFDYVTIKYDPDLVVMASATYNDPVDRDDCAYGIALDKDGNILVTGYSSNGINYDFCTIKYDPNLVVIASVTYNGPANGIDQARGIAVDKDGNIIVTGSSYDGLNEDYRTLKYGPDLAVIASATYNGPANGADSAYGVALDRDGNVIVTGSSSNGSNKDYCTIKYGPDLVVIASATYNGLANGDDVAYGAAVDGTGNIIVTGGSRENAVFSYGTIKFSGPPAVTACTPGSGEIDTTLDTVVTGANFQPGLAVSFGDGITVNSVARESAGRLTANITIAADAAVGARTVTVTNTDTAFGAKSGAFTVLQSNAGSATADPSADATVTISPLSGDITVTVPAGTFTDAVTLAVSTAAVPASTGSGFKVTNVGIEVSAQGRQPGKNITLTVYYRDADIAGLDESKLTLARYENGRWIPVPTVVYAGENKLVGTVRHLSTFAVVQLAPAGDLAGVTAYPNPFDPKSGGMTIANLTGEAEIRIYNVAGELVRTLAYTSADGRAAWDGKNDAGSQVASGVYLAVIQSPQGKKTIKIAVER